MKFRLIIVKSEKNPSLELWLEEYLEKISRFAKFECVELKSPSAPREQSDFKVQAEEKLILKKIEKDDFVVVLDEVGAQMSSVEWSRAQTKIFDSGKSQVVFVIGGAFGLSEAVKARANLKWSLSKLTFNHHLAAMVLLEQIYRGFCIQKGIRYHN